MVAAQETNLQKILEGTVQYVVPLYQRPYAWCIDQVRELWQDIVQLVDDRCEESDTSHFIGSLVLAPTPGSVAGAVTRILVVDGQQRLTTVTLLLAAIRDHLRDGYALNRRDIDRINNQLLTNQYEDDPFRLKLLPTQADRDSYLAVIDQTPTAGAADSIGEAYNFFRARLASRDTESAGAIAQIVQAVIASLTVVSISTHPGDNVHRIFQSLNNSGLELTQGDLLRNYLFMRLPTRSEEVYRGHWLPLQRALEDNDRIETLFWLDLLHAKPKVKQSQTFAGQQARLEGFRSELEIVAEVQRFAELARLYRLMLNPAEETDPAVRERLLRLVEWDSTTPAPLVLHLLWLRHNGEVTSDQLARALLFIEALMVRRFLTSRLPQGLNRLFAAAVQELDRTAPVDQALHRYLSAGRKHYAADEDLVDAILIAPFCLNGRAAQRKTMMLWIERLLAAKELVRPDGLTIEHIMPQTLTDRWCSDLAAVAGGEDIDDLHGSLVHTLGNLTLTGYNESLSNHEFERKRKLLVASSIRMNQEIAEQPVWGRSQIENRCRALAARIIAEWPAPIGQSAGGRDENPMWDSLNRLLALLPAGHWTTYGDLASLLGTAAQPLGTRLAAVPVPNAHRVLNSGGSISAGFHWIDPECTDDPLAVLEREGIRFTAKGKADPAQRLTVGDLERLRVAAEDDTDGSNKPELVAIKEAGVKAPAPT